MRPKTTKTVKLGLQTTSKKLQELTAEHDDLGALFKLKKFRKTKPRTDTVNKNYIPPSIFNVNNGKF